MNLAINLVTRGRPELLLETVSRTIPLVSRDDTVFVISIDKDDTETIAALNRLTPDKRIIPIIEEREDAIGDKYGRVLRFPADVYMCMCDYVPYVTRGFDAEVLKAATVFPDGIGVVYNYLADNITFGSLNGITAKLIEKMGFLYPSIFPFWFVDHWLDDIARYIDRIAFAPIQVDRKNVDKRTTTGRRDVRFWSVLFDALYLRRQECARNIINGDDFKDAPWRKRRSLEMFPYIEQRSRMINAATRQNSGQYEPLPLSGNEELRYSRIKANGDRIMREAIAEIEMANAQ